ncbi:MAG: thermonuclease family protein [Hyphomicrobiaceae bacterium]
MFGWRKKNDGFVWNEYVRTTILLRREHRKQKIEDVREAAVDGLKHAGRQSVALSVAGASAAGRGLWSGLQTAVSTIGDWLSIATAATWLWVADRSQPAREVLADAAARAFEVLRRPAVTAPLLLIAAVAAMSATVRWNEYGRDRDAIIAAVIAVLAGSAVVVPQLARINFSNRIGSSFQRLPFADRLRSMSGEAVGSAVGTGAVLVAIIGAVSWLGPALMSGTDIQQAVSSASPVLTPASGRVEGKAVVLTGGQMRIDGETVQLFGVEIPMAGQQCAGTKSCASAAKTALQKLVGGKRVTCEISGREANNASSATCKVNGADIAGQLVRGGHVFATTGLFATYASAEREARSNRTGLWRNNALRPTEFRAKVWEDAKQSAPGGCPIKGTVAGDNKTYLVPWAPSYDKAKVRPDRGERWFCTEAEARAAGWKASDAS